MVYICYYTCFNRNLFLYVFFFYKMILAETKYEMHNGEFWAIIEVFKILKHYLKDSAWGTCTHQPQQPLPVHE